MGRFPETYNVALINFGSRCVPPTALNPGARFSKVPVTFRARNQIFKSKYEE